MHNDLILWRLAKLQQAEFLREAELNQQLQDAGLLKRLRLPRKLLLGLACALPLVLVLARAAGLWA